jgi:hypothetical protein
VRQNQRWKVAQRVARLGWPPVPLPLRLKRVLRLAMTALAEKNEDDLDPNECADKNQCTLNPDGPRIVNRELILILLKAVLPVCLLSVLAVIGRAHLERAFGASIDPRLYFLVSAPLLWVFVLIWARGPLRELKQRTGTPPKVLKLAEPRGKFADRGVQSVHRYPLRLRLMVLSFILPIVLLIVVVDKPITTVTLPGYSILFGVATLVVLVAFNAFRYSVTLTSRALTIKGLWFERIILRSEIVDAQVKRGKGGPLLVIVLRSGKKVTIWSFVTDFQGLLSGLSA